MTDTNDSQLKSGDDLVADALAQTSAPTIDGEEDEVAQSDKVAQALTALQNVIERNANELNQINDELKHKRESLKNVFENDQELSVAEEQAKTFSNQVKERRAKLQADPQSTSLKVDIGELSERKKEIEETLSNHLVNYYQLTHSTSFDTSDGDQWEFKIQARVKPRKSRSEE